MTKAQELKSLVNQLRERVSAKWVGSTGGPCTTRGYVPDAICVKAADAIDAQQSIIDEQRDELERERIRLAACGVVALSNTPESAAKAREMLPEYRSASCDDVAKAVDREMQYRTELAEARAEIERQRADYERACKLVADMHAAAVGAYTGPTLGVVEDVAALRLELERLRVRDAEIERLTKDAERYRWLRNRPFGPLRGSEFTEGVCIDFWDAEGSGNQLRGEAADASIDAAIAAGSQTELKGGV